MKSALPLVALLALILSSGAYAQDEPWYDHDPHPQEMTPEEELRRHEIGMGFRASTPPSGEIRAIAEFERNEAVLIRYPLSIPIALVASMSEIVPVITIVSGQSQQNQAIGAYQSNGVNMENVQFLQAPTNTTWTRDYGPFYIVTEDHEVSIVDFVYNRPRPADNAIPAALGSYLDIPVYAMDVVHTGGNYMTDGLGVAASTDILIEENNNNQMWVLQNMQAYMGIGQYHITIDPMDPNGIKHIDTWAKYLDVDKVLIAEVSPGDPRYADYEAVVDYFEAQVSPWGTPYQIYRVYSPNGQPYTNSLILNERVYVPLASGAGAAWNAAAIEAYQAAMPGYEVLGFTGSWLSNDALHCRVKEIADRGMLYIEHTPLTGEHPYEPAFELTADVIPYSGADLIDEELYLIFRAEGRAAFDTLALNHVDGYTFSASIPIDPEGGEIAYYFSAADESGRKETFPLIGPEGARTFSVQASPVSTEPGLADGRFHLETPYPNPSAGEATVRYYLAAPTDVTLVVYDVLGREVARLADGTGTTGWNSVELPRDLGAGTYVVQLTADGERTSRPFTRVR